MIAEILGNNKQQAVNKIGWLAEASVKKVSWTFQNFLLLITKINKMHL